MYVVVVPVPRSDRNIPAPSLQGMLIILHALLLERKNCRGDETPSSSGVVGGGGGDNGSGSGGGSYRDDFGTIHPALG